MKKIILILLGISLISPSALSAATSETIPTFAQATLDRPTVRIFDPISGVLKREFHPFPETSPVEGVNIASGDVNGDGLNEIVVASGRNEKPLIRIFSNQGKFLNEFKPYKENFTKGFKVIVAKLYSDKTDVIITAPNEGGGAHIKIFNDQGELLTEFFSEQSSMLKGVNVTAGDINGDDNMEIIIGSGYPDKPLIKIYDKYGNYLSNFTPFNITAPTGTVVMALNINSDKVMEIAVTPYLDANSEIKIFDFKGNILQKFNSYPQNYFAGLTLTSADIDGDKIAEIITGSGYGYESEIKFFTAEGILKAIPIINPFPDFKGGVSVACADLDNDGQMEILAGTQTISRSNKYESYKIIEVDLAKQKMFTYFKGLPVKQFIVSTGKSKFPTPQGSYKINSKILKAGMTGYYGPDNPENYNLSNVPHIMYFYKNYAIHGAYWHWKFGTRVSHGCINLKLPDAKWLYEWSNIGTPVYIYSSK